MLEALKSISKKSLRWFRYEYFYSQSDRPFFQENELMDAVERAGLPLELNSREWAVVRQTLADSVIVDPASAAKARKGKLRKRRLFSQNFIKEEKTRL